jgi:general secretion pathway protein D
MVVEDGQSLLIGGIISSNKNNEQHGIPFLMDIPYLGALFRTTTVNEDKTELFMVLTPRVVGNPDEGRALTEEFRNRLDALEKGITRPR